MRRILASGRQLVDARCHEYWLPRVSFQVGNSTTADVRIFSQLAEGRIAVEAQYASDPTRLAAVIHMCGRSIQADHTEPALSGDHRVALGLGEAVVPLQLARSPLGRTTQLAPGREAVRGGRVAMPLAPRFGLTARPAEFVTVGHVHPGTNLSAFGDPTLLVTSGGALPAAALQPVTHRLVLRERRPRLVLPAPRAALRTFFALQPSTPPPPSDRRENWATAHPSERRSERSPPRSPPRHRRSRPGRSPRRRSASRAAP